MKNILTIYPCSKHSGIQFTLRNSFKKYFISLSANLSKKNFFKLMETSKAPKKLLPMNFQYKITTNFSWDYFLRLQIVDKKWFQFFSIIIKMFSFLKMVVKFNIFSMYRFSNFLLLLLWVKKSWNSFFSRGVDNKGCFFSCEGKKL